MGAGGSGRCLLAARQRRPASPRRSAADRGRILASRRRFGLGGLVMQAWLIGLRGWSYSGLAARSAISATVSSGWASAARSTFAGFLLLLTEGLALLGRFGGDRFVAARSGCCGLIALFTIWPVADHARARAF